MDRGGTLGGMSDLALPSSHPLATGQVLVETLRRRLGGAELIETHISWLLLTPERVYKLRKPVQLGFLDFSTAEARRLDCLEEVRLNRRLAPALYLGVVAITGSAEAPELSHDPMGATSVIDHAVEMRRFPAGALLSEQLAAGTLQRGHLQGLAQRLAVFHAAAPRARVEDPCGTPQVVGEAVAQVLRQLKEQGVEVTDLSAWIDQQTPVLQTHWQARRAQGAVREVHGDLHLANAVLLDGAATAFDCIEFNPALRWIDVLSDIAFLMMDLLAHQRHDLAWAFLDAYLQASGDYAGLPGLRFYLVYRALVRAMVQTLRPDASTVGPDYLALARHLIQSAAPRLLITHGLSGSGKTWVTQGLLETAGAVRLRSDVERKRLFGLAALQRSAAVPGGIYGTEAGRRTFERLAELTRISLQSGWPTLVDAAFLKRAERDRFAALALECGVPFTILHCHADPAVLAQRVQARSGRGDDASEADLAVLQRQQSWVEPLGEAERGVTLDAAAVGGVVW